MSELHGLLTPDAEGRLEPVTYAIASNVVRGTPDETGFTYLTSEDGTTEIGVWACGAYCERLENYPFNELCVVIEGSVEITPDSGETTTYREGDTFFMAKGFTGLWESHSRFKKYVMACRS